MRSHVVVSLITIVCLLAVSCQATSPAGLKEASAASSVQDVSNAWNNYCSQHNFSDADVQSSVTLGSLYSGSDFHGDIGGLLRDMQTELDSATRPPADSDDLLSAVLNDPIWFK